MLRVSIVPLEALDTVSQARLDVKTVLKAVGGLLGETPRAVPLATAAGTGAASSSSPQLLLHHDCSTRAQLLSLQSVSTHQTAAGPARSELYTAAVLQHAALLLLLLVSDSSVLILPTDAVPPVLLQLLHLLATVHQALLQQLRQQQQGAGGTGSALCTLLAGRKEPVQIHIALQASAQQHAQDPDSWPATAATAVQQAEQTLLKCKAAALSPALLQQQQQQQQGTGSGRRRTAVSSSSSSRKALLFELAGVHCCCKGGGPNTVPAKRRAVLAAVQQQLLACNRSGGGALQLMGSTTKQQQQLNQPGGAADIQPAATAALPGLDQLLRHVVASTAAAAAGGAAGDAQQAVAGSPARAAVTQQQLEILWQDLLHALFGSTLSWGQQGPTRQPYVILMLHDITLTPDDVTQGDGESSVSEDSWDDADEGWEEVQQQDDQQQQQGGQQQGPGWLLAAAVDPLFVVSARSCKKAAVAALRAYTQAVPQRYTAAVHAAAVQQALQLYASAASGPAVPDLRAQLQSCCQQVWEAGRQQCSQLSLTGRPCVLSPHNTVEQLHSSNTQLQVCAPNGSTALTVPDWFDLTAANTTPAQQLLAQQGASAAGAKQQQQQQAAELGQLLSVAARLVAPQAAAAVSGDSSSSSNTVVAPLGRYDQHYAAADAGSSSTGEVLNPAATAMLQQSRHPAVNPTLHGTQILNPRVILGPWMSCWQLGLKDSAYDPQAGLPGSAWIPGFNKLQQLRVLAPAAEPSSADAAAAAAAGGSGAGVGPPTGQQQQQQRQPQKKQDFASQLKRKGAGGRGAGAVSRTPEPVLGPEDFPTLQQALGSKHKKHTPSAAATVSTAGAAAAPAAGANAQPRADAKGIDAQAGAKSATGDAGVAAAQQVLQQQQQQRHLVTAWAQLAAPQAAGSSTAAAAAAGLPDVGTAVSDRQAIGGRGAARGGRGGRGPAAAPGRGRQGCREATVQPVEVPAAVLASLWIGVEYESLAGQRMILQPQQLAAIMQQLHPQPQPQPQPQQQQQQPDTSFAAAAAAGAGAATVAAAMRDMPHDSRHRRGGRQQQQQQRGAPGSPRHGHSAAQHGRQVAAAGSKGSSIQGPALQLLHADIPLYLNPHQLRMPGLQASAAAAAGGSDSSSSLAVPLSLLQLQRIYVRTPPGPLCFAAKPQLRFSWQVPQQAAEAAGTAGPDDMQTAAAIGSDGRSGIVFECVSDTVLAPDSLVVLNLPKVYAAPREWWQANSPAAAVNAAATAAAAAVGSNELASKPTAEVQAAAAAAEAGDSQCEQGMADNTSNSSSSTMALDPGTAAASEPGAAEAGRLIPLLPVRTTWQASGTFVNAAEAGGWSAVLCAGSWLFPVDGSTAAAAVVGH